MYQVNECFYSLQGEGVRAGTANVFVRFAGCNLRCSMDAYPGGVGGVMGSPGGFDCDTEFISGRQMTTDEIVARCSELWPERRTIDRQGWVILTGGEPGLQVNTALLIALREAWFRVAVETNGTIDWEEMRPLVNWLTVSPKVAEHAIRQRKADEVKYVRFEGQEIPRTVVEAGLKLISPAWDPATGFRSLQWCIKLVRDNPEWRLSQQLHKIWGAR